MSGRPAAVLKLYDERNTKKQGKKIVEARLDAELRIGDDKYVLPSELESDIEAMSEWYRITNLYKKAGLRITSNSDVNIIFRYCTLWSNLKHLQSIQTELPTIAQTSVTSQGNDKIEETEDFLKWKNIDKLIRLDMDMLLKLEDRLFLNPLAKFKHIPMIVKKDKKKEELEKLGFGNI